MNVVVVVVVALLSSAASGAGTRIPAEDPLAGARAAFAAGRFDEAKTLAGDAAPGLAGAALERAGDAASACALYEKDRASTRAPAAALRSARCKDAAGDVPGALAAYAEVGASALADDPLVVKDIAAFIDKHDLPAAALARALDMPVGLFDDVRRNALADALLVVVARGDKQQQQQAMERLLVELPDTTAGKKAAALPEAKLATSAAALDLPTAVKKASALADRHESDAVVAMLEPLLAAEQAKQAKAKTLSAPECEARLLLGKTYRKLRKYGAAKKNLDLVATKCSDDVKKRASYLGARVAWMSKSSAAATLLRAFADAWPEDPLTDDVLLWLGDVKERDGDAAAAQQAWSKILTAFPDGDMIHEARFRLAWSRAAAGDVEGARAALDDAARLAPSTGRVDVADRALYWRARLGLAPKLDSLDVTSDAKKRDAALAELSALAQSRPASWYGHLARLLVVDAAARAKLDAPALDVRGHVRDGAPAASLTASPALTSDARFTLAQNLVAAGYDDEALLVLGSLAAKPPAPAATSASTAGEDRFVVALLLGRAGAPGAGHALLRDAGLALLPGTPSAENALAWSLDWPQAYPASVAAAADEHQLPRALLFGLAREESAFDASVVSWAGAVGLCQLMMPTAGDEAKSKKLPAPSVDDLKDPVLNARLGASHLSRRMKGLKHPALAIAAYNAGPGAVLGWKPKGPVDTWVEQIPVDETRNYVKKVTGSWVTYAILDGTVDDVKFPLELR